MVSGPGRPAAHSASWNWWNRPAFDAASDSARRGDAVGPEDRQLAIDDAQALILLQQPVDVRVARFAIGAGVIEEFDQHDVGLGGALPRRCRTAFRSPRGWRSSTGAYCGSRSASAVSTRICGSASMPCADDPAADILRHREQQGAGGQHALRSRPPQSPAPSADPLPLAHSSRLLPVLYLLVFLAARSATPWRCPGREDSRECRAGSPLSAISALASASLGLPSRLLRSAVASAARDAVAFAVVDDAQLIPGEGVLVVAVDRGFQDLLGLGEILAAPRSRSARGRASRRSAAGRRTVRSLRAAGRCASAGLPDLEQDLALELEEEGVVAGWSRAAPRPPTALFPGRRRRDRRKRARNAPATLWSLSGYLMTACLGLTKPISLALTRWKRASSAGSGGRFQAGSF